MSVRSILSHEMGYNACYIHTPQMRHGYPLAPKVNAVRQAKTISRATREAALRELALMAEGRHLDCNTTTGRLVRDRELQHASKNPSRCHSGRILRSGSKRHHATSSGLVAAGLMAQGGGTLLPRLDGVALEQRVAGEDHRTILLARTLTELEIAKPSDWERSPSKNMCCPT
jgi:hypothetical protein